MKWTSLLILILLATFTLHSCKKDDDSDAYVISDVIFESDRQEISAGDSIVFKDHSTGYVTRWKWSFEGGTPAESNLSSPTVVYASPGIYEVTVELSNAMHSAVLTKKEYIKVDYNQVQADFTATPLVAFIGDPVSFRDSSTGSPTAWQWEFKAATSGTILTSTDEDPVLTFTETGYYEVSLTASNPSYSHKKTKENFIHIIDPNAVSADFSSVSSATYAGGSIAFTDKSIGLVTGWDWKFEGPVTLSSQEQNPVVQFSTPGRYTVSLTASNDNASTTKTQSSFILVVPGADLAAFFPFDGSVADAGPHTINSSELGAGVSFSNADRLSRIGHTGTFSGATGVIVDDHTAINFGAANYSVSCWIKTSNTGKMMIWQESGKNGSGDNQTWLRMGDNTTDRRLRFTIEDASGSSIINMGSAGFVADDQWHHIVAVREGVNTLVYIDGVKIAERATTNLKSVSNDQSFKIGVQEGASSNSSFFAGEIDDVILYNKALSETEVQQLFNL